MPGADEADGEPNATRSSLSSARLSADSIAATASSTTLCGISISSWYSWSR